MSVVVGVLMGLGGVLVAIVVWRSLPVDRVGKDPRLRRQEVGVQGRLTEWLYWDAPLEKPHVKRVLEPGEAPLTGLADRCLSALLGRLRTERRLSLQEAHKVLKKDARSPASKSFLDGRMNRAVRLFWRDRYDGPPVLFNPWYYLVASVRYGRRRMYLETLAGILQELQRR